MQNTEAPPYIETDLACTFKKDQTVLIPAALRNRLNFHPGCGLCVSFGERPGEIQIMRNHSAVSENLMVVNKSGGIRIPSELKKIMNIEEFSRFQILLLSGEKGLVLRLI